MMFSIINLTSPSCHQHNLQPRFVFRSMQRFADTLSLPKCQKNKKRLQISANYTAKAVFYLNYFPSQKNETPLHKSTL